MTKHPSIANLICFVFILAFLPVRNGSVSMGSENVGIVRPIILSDEWDIELVASEPQIVTPISCRFDPKGRLLVIESHTHFPPDDYEGPKHDRIYLFDDTNGDGKLDRQRLFYEGGRASMGLEVMGNGDVIVARRDTVVRLRDTDLDDRADQTDVILRLETVAEYPHNGLGGLAIGPDGWLYVGQGENLGEPYQLVGIDGSIQKGKGEGGNIFRCRPDGTQLERFATGFWNPFGLHFDQSGRLWAVCNDPDAKPPCRLMHVVHASDFGFQFRFGRAGTHPLLAWNGEHPGTLPMAAGTGEAPCAVVSYEDRLLVSAWGDNRIESYRLKPQGATWKGTRETIVQGNSDFRPVDFATAKDGSIYITDWVDRSYPVHGLGRLWRLVPKKHHSDQRKLPQLSADEILSKRLANDPTLSLAELLQAATSADPYIRQGAASGLSRRDMTAFRKPEAFQDEAQQICILSALRWLSISKPDQVMQVSCDEWIEAGLASSNDGFALAAIRWAAETGEIKFLPIIRKRLVEKEISRTLFRSAVAAIAYLEAGTASRGRRDPSLEHELLEIAADPSRPATLRAMAIDTLPAESESPDGKQAISWLHESPNPKLAQAIIRLLISRGDQTSIDAMATLGQSSWLDPESKADAISGLSKDITRYEMLLKRISVDETDSSVRQEAARILRTPSAENLRPASDDIEAWNRLIGEGGNPRAGWRVFNRTACVRCHAYEGRGSLVGPDLTGISGVMDRRRILESILLPSKEIGPPYVPWLILTEDGRTLTGLKLNDGSGTHTKFIGSDGEVFEVPMEMITSQRPTAESVMPKNLEETLTTEEFRDLLSFLSGDKAATEVIHE